VGLVRRTAVWGAGLLYEGGHGLKAEYQHYYPSGVHPEKGGGSAAAQNTPKPKFKKKIVDG